MPDNSDEPVAQSSNKKEKKQMSILKAVTTTVFGVALMGAVFSPAAKADEWNRKTTMTFSGPVEIPGVHLKGWGVLPAGTYVFKILDSQSDRHIVQIFSADENDSLRHHSGDPELSPQGDRQDRSYFPGTAGRRAGSAARMVLSRQKLGRGICLSEGQGSGVGQDNQHADSLYGGRDSGGSRAADQDGGRAGGRATEAGARHGDQPTGEEVELAAGGHPAAGIELSSRTPRRWQNRGCDTAETASCR